MFNGTYKGKKVLVTGDTGFKGSWLCIWLRELGAHVYGYSLPPKSPRDNYVTAGLDQLIHHMDGDVRDHKKFAKYFEDVQPDIAFHLAAQPLVRESYRYPRETFETNVMGTVNFFEAVRATKSVKAAVNVTTDKCYRNNEQMEGYKEEDPLGGRDPYSASKSCSEMVTSAYLNSFFESAVCLVASARAGNVIGGGDWAEDRIVPDLFKAVSQKKSLSIRHPHSVRPWQHVLEPLAGYLLLASSLYQEKRTSVGSWNFGPLESGHVTVLELVKEILKALGRGEYSIEVQEGHVHEARFLKLDVTKSMTHLQWKPALSFQETVIMTVEGYEAELKTGKVYQHRAQQIAQYTEKIR